MPITLLDAVRRSRSALDEPAYPTLPGSTATTGPLQRFFTDTEITDWINDGLRDISRRAETLITYDTTIAIPAYGENPNQPVPTYSLNLGTIPAVYQQSGAQTQPSDVIRINRIEFQVYGDSSQIYPLEAATQAYLDQIWGVDQLSTQSYPGYYTTRGYPGGSGRNAFVIQIYPNPAQAGNLNIYYYRMPLRIPDPGVDPSNYGLTLDLLDGWDDMLVDYVIMKGKMKRRDPSWKDQQEMYESKVGNIVDVTRRFNDAPQYFSYDNMLSPWGGDGWGGNW
jgi:hypothetical protein